MHELNQNNYSKVRCIYAFTIQFPLKRNFEQGNNILGMGRRNLVKVSVDEHCRMDLNTLEAHLQVFNQ